VSCLSVGIGRGFRFGRFLGLGCVDSSSDGSGSAKTIMGSPRFSKDSMAALKAGRLSSKLIGFSVVGSASLVGVFAHSDGAASATRVDSAAVA